MFPLATLGFRFQCLEVEPPLVHTKMKTWSVWAATSCLLIIKIRHVNCQCSKLPAHYFQKLTNQLAVFLTGWWTTNQTLAECCRSIIKNHKKLIPMLTWPILKIALQQRVHCCKPLVVIYKKSHLPHLIVWSKLSDIGCSLAQHNICSLIFHCID